MFTDEYEGLFKNGSQDNHLWRNFLESDEEEFSRYFFENQINMFSWFSFGRILSEMFNQV